MLAAVFALSACAEPPGNDPPDRPVAAHTDGPPYPAPDPAAIARFREWQDRLALPAVYLEPAGPARFAPGGSRIGGPAWLAQGERWPADARGQPMTFLAQVDFAALPPLPDYPRSGVLQFFIGRDMNYGADYQRANRGSFKVIYRPDFAAAGSLRSSPVRIAGTDHLAPIDGTTVTEGVALTGVAGKLQPDHQQLAVRA